MRNCRRFSLAIGMWGTIVVATGCDSPVSPSAFEHAKSLYTVSNMRSAESVALAEQRIEADLAAGQLSRDEAERLREICTQCRDAEWQDAQSAARRMMDVPPKS